MIETRFASVERVPGGCVSVFRDGARWGAFPPAPGEDTRAHYHVIAHRCGYGDDLAAYCLEHEVAHHVVAEVLLDRPSPVLWGLAHGAELPAGEAALEEIAAQALQRFARAAERPIVGGIDWDAMRARFVEVLQ